MMLHLPPTGMAPAKCSLSHSRRSRVEVMCSSSERWWSCTVGLTMSSSMACVQEAGKA